MASNQIQMGVNFRKNINTKSAANGKVKNVQVVQSLADFRTANAPSNNSGGGGPLPVGGDTEVDPDDGE